MTRLKGSRNKPKGSNRSGKLLRFQSSIYRLNVSYLSGFGTYSTSIPGTKRLPDLSPELDQLKSNILSQILKHQNHRHLRYYTIAWETHPTTGEPHLDILLVYDKNIKKSLSSYNYLLPLCPQRPSSTTPGIFITSYPKSRLNKAILEYGTKEDPTPISNLPEDTTSVLDLNKLQHDPYSYLYKQMKKDPLSFN